MKKPVSKLDAYQQHKMKWTARFGYAMFALVIINVLFSGASIIESVRNVQNGGGRFLSQFLWFVGLSALAAVIPPVVAYLVGGRKAKTNSPYEHHYNGVLFALLAGWLTLAFAFLPVNEFSYIYIPAVIAVISLFITLVVALAYGTHAKSVRLQQYLPYRIMLIATIVFIVGGGVISTMTSVVEGADLSVLPLSIVPILIGGLIVWFGYKASRERDPWSRIIDSLVALSIGTWTANLFMLCLLGFRVISFIQEAPLLVGILAWAVYLYLIHLRAPHTKRKSRR